jgi:hypothetical protein
MSDVFWQSIIAAVCTVILAWFQFKLQAMLHHSDVKLDDLGKVAAATHTLVNSNMGTQLKLNAIMARRLSDLTKSPVDVEAALEAEKLYAAHMQNQDVVDQGVASQNQM